MSQYTIEPTGRIRHRIHKTWLNDPVLVLQAEVTETHGNSVDTYWRDAKAEDVTRMTIVTTPNKPPT